MRATSSAIWRDIPCCLSSLSWGHWETNITIVHHEALSAWTLKWYLFWWNQVNKVYKWRHFGHGEHVTDGVWMETGSAKLHSHQKTNEWTWDVPSHNQFRCFACMLLKNSTTAISATASSNALIWARLCPCNWKFLHGQIFVYCNFLKKLFCFGLLILRPG